jgi:MFS family permease
MPNNPSKPVFFYGWLMVVAAFFLQFIAWGTNATFGVFLTPLSRDLGWSRALIAGAFSCGTASRGLLSIIAGKLNDRYGPRVLVTIGGSSLALAHLLLAYVTSLWQFYLIYGFLVGLGMSVTFVPLATTIVEWFREKRATATAIFMVGASFGGLIMAPVASGFISAYGWRTSYTIIGVIAFVVVLSCGPVLRRGPGAARKAKPVAGQADHVPARSAFAPISFRAVARTKQFWIFCAIVFCGFFCHFTVSVHLVAHSIDTGIPTRIAPYILATLSGTAIVGRIGIGAAADQVGHKAVLMVCLAILGIDCLWLMVARGLWMFFGFAAVFGLVSSVCMVLSSPMVADHYGLGSHGTILGTIMMSGTIGGAFGPLFSGCIFDITGSYNPALIVCAGFCGLAVALLMRLDRRDMGQMPERLSTARS